MSTYPDANNNPTHRFEPLNYRGAFLCPNIDDDDNPIRNRPVGIRDAVPSDAAGALEFYLEEVPATV